MLFWVNSNKSIFLKRPPTILPLFFVEVYVSIKFLFSLFALFYFTAGEDNELFPSFKLLPYLLFCCCGVISFVISIGIGISENDFTSIIIELFI